MKPRTAKELFMDFMSHKTGMSSLFNNTRSGTKSHKGERHKPHQGIREKARRVRQFNLKGE